MSPARAMKNSEPHTVTTSGVSGASGDVWTTNVGFVSPLPVLPSGHYTATLTYTVIGQ